MLLRVGDAVPYKDEYRLTASGESVYEKGIYYEFLKKIQNTLGCNFSFVFPDDRGFGGVKLANGTWTGVMGLFQQNKVDIALGVGFTQERSELVDFSNPLTIDHIAFAVKKDIVTSNSFDFLKTFQSPAWAAIFFFILSCIFVLSAMIMRSSPLKCNLKNFLKNIASSAEIIFGMRSFRTLRDLLSNKMFCGTAMMYMRVLGYCFVAVFFMFLVAPPKAPPIRTFEELGAAARTEQVKVAFRKDSQIGVILRSAKNGTLKFISDNGLKHMGKGNKIDIGNLLRRGHVVVHYLTELKQEIASSGTEHEIFISKENLGITHSGIIFQKPFKYKEKTNRIILEFVENRVYEKLYSTYIALRKSHYETLSEASPFLKPVSLSDLAGIFSIWGMCLIIALLLLLCKICVCRGASRNVSQGGGGGGGADGRDERHLTKPKEKNIRVGSFDEESKRIRKK